MNNQEDPLWVRAKDIAKNRSLATDWAYIISVYKYLGGSSVGVQVTHEDSIFLLAGVYTDNLSLLYNPDTEEIITADSTVVKRDKKKFIKTSSDSVLFTGYPKNKKANLTDMSLLSGEPIVVYGEV